MSGSVESSAHASHGYVRYNDVRCPPTTCWAVRAGVRDRPDPARRRPVHHAMRTIALARKAFDMMCERAVSRQTQLGPLGDFQLTQEKIADSWIEIERFRLLVLRTAWKIDKLPRLPEVRRGIAAVKVAMPKVLHDVVMRAMQLHGSLGVSDEMPFVKMLVASHSPWRSPMGRRRCTS